MYCALTTPQATLVIGLLTSVIVVVGWYSTHRTALTREREARAHADKIAREDRLRDFEGFLVEKEQITEAALPEHIPSMYFGETGRLNCGILRREAAKIRRDVPPDKLSEFDVLEEGFARMSPGTLKGGPEDSRNKMAGAIRALLKFVRSIQ